MRAVLVLALTAVVAAFAAPAQGRALSDFSDLPELPELPTARLDAALEDAYRDYDATLSSALADMHDRNSHLQKRGITSWIDGKVLDPLVNLLRPKLFHVVDIAVNESTVVVAEALPRFMQHATRVALGIDPTKKHGPHKCGWFQVVCDAIMPHYDNFTFKLKNRIVASIQGRLIARKQAITDLVVLALKRKVFISEEGRARLGKRGLKSWYVNKINRSVQNIMVVVRPLLHNEVRTAVDDYVATLPKILRNGINSVMPDRLKMDEHPKEMANPFDYLRRKVAELHQAMLGSIKGMLDKVVVFVEESMMKVVIRTTQRLIAETLPFFDDADADFTPKTPGAAAAANATMELPAPPAPVNNNATILLVPNSSRQAAASKAAQVAALENSDAAAPKNPNTTASENPDNTAARMILLVPKRGGSSA